MTVETCTLSAASCRKLATCDPRLVEIVTEVARYLPAVVVCGHRGQAEQELAVQRGASRVHWPESRHNTEPSLAVDLAPRGEAGEIDWSDRQAFAVLAGAMLFAARQRGVALEWGGEWAFPDLPHFQIERS